MRRLINKLTGGDMWVADNRVDEYLAAGHKLAAGPKPAKVEAPIMNEPEAKEVEDQEEQEEKPVKKSAIRSRKR